MVCEVLSLSVSAKPFYERCEFRLNIDGKLITDEWVVMS